MFILIVYKFVHMIKKPMENVNIHQPLSNDVQRHGKLLNQTPHTQPGDLSNAKKNKSLERLKLQQCFYITRGWKAQTGGIQQFL